MADSRKRLLPEAMRLIDSSTLTGSYQAVGTPLVHESRVLLFVNESTVTVTVSWDGTTAAFRLVAGAQFVFDETSNAVSNSVLVTSAGTQFYVKGSAGAGDITISTFYAN